MMSRLARYSWHDIYLFVIPIRPDHGEEVGVGDEWEMVVVVVVVLEYIVNETVSIES